MKKVSIEKLQKSLQEKFSNHFDNDSRFISDARSMGINIKNINADFDFNEKISVKLKMKANLSSRQLERMGLEYVSIYFNGKNFSYDNIYEKKQIKNDVVLMKEDEDLNKNIPEKTQEQKKDYRKILDNLLNRLQETLNEEITVFYKDIKGINSVYIFLTTKKDGIFNSTKDMLKNLNYKLTINKVVSDYKILTSILEKRLKLRIPPLIQQKRQLVMFGMFDKEFTLRIENVKLQLKNIQQNKAKIEDELKEEITDFSQSIYLYQLQDSVENNFSSIKNEEDIQSLLRTVSLSEYTIKRNFNKVFLNKLESLEIDTTAVKDLLL